MHLIDDQQKAATRQLTSGNTPLFEKTWVAEFALSENMGRSPSHPRHQVIDQAQTQFALVHAAIRLAQLVQYCLKERPSRAEPAAGQQHDAKAVFELFGDLLAQQGLAGAHRPEQHADAFPPLDTAQAAVRAFSLAVAGKYPSTMGTAAKGRLFRPTKVSYMAQLSYPAKIASIFSTQALWSIASFRLS